MKRVQVLVASDHAAIEMKSALRRLLPEIEWNDLGPTDTQSVDYPDYASKLCQKLVKTPEALGVLICGSGIGMSIAANKHPGIRAALVENPVSARLSREHNHANVLCLGARFLAPEYAAEIIRTWVSAEPSQDARHLGRVEKLNRLV